MRRNVEILANLFKEMGINDRWKEADAIAWVLNGLNTEGIWQVEFVQNDGSHTFKDFESYEKAREYASQVGSCVSFKIK